MAGLVKATDTASLSQRGTCCSGIIMKAISIGMSLKETSALSPSMPLVKKAGSSPVVEVERCSQACSPAAGVEDGGALSIRDALQATLITAANVSTRCSPNRDA